VTSRLLGILPERFARVAASLAVDAGLLRRRPALARLIGAQLLSELGSALTMVAMPVQVYRLTGSTVAVGLLGAAELAPIIALALIGGALADAFDRRTLIRLAELSSALLAVALAGNAALAYPSVAVVYAGAALLSAVTAVRRPPMDALVPRLVERDELKAAVAVQWGLVDIAMVAGPSAGGILIAGAGLDAGYAVAAAMFAGALAVLGALRTPPPPEDAEPFSVRGVAEGLRYAASRQELVGTYVVDINAMFFGMPMALFPALAQQYGGTAVVGLLYAAPGAGSILATLTSGWARRVHRHGRAVVFAAIGWGLGIIGFGLADVLWLALVCLAVAGGFDAVSGIFRATIWNETIPDRLRGRLAGVEMISWSTGPLLGNAEAGVAARVLGLQASVVAGGALCVVGSLALAAALPRFWGYVSEAPPDPAPLDR
jgi:MFS family permease